MLGVEGREVTIEIIKAGPVTRGKHYHAAHSFSWIIDGSEVQTVPGKAPITVKAGAVIHEEPMQVNESENVGLVMVIAVRTSLTNERTLQDANRHDRPGQDGHHSR